MPTSILCRADGTEETYTYFDGVIRAVHADGTRCPRSGKGRHTQRPRDPRCPGRAKYVATCRLCTWEGESPSHVKLRAESKAHARECDDRQPYIMTAEEFVNLPPAEQAAHRAWNEMRDALPPEQRPPVLTVAQHRERTMAAPLAAPPAPLLPVYTPPLPRARGLLNQLEQVPDTTDAAAHSAAVEAARAAGRVYVGISRTDRGWCVYAQPDTDPGFRPHLAVTRILGQAVARLVREGDGLGGGSTTAATAVTGVPDEYRARIYALAFQNALAGDLDRLLRLWTVWR
ncbi:hypothetical protein OHS33_37115 [Streptomyces sp. NBC_00536]|uniref:hypothetical protein n=1 Tax=Streptomyces sp. NBC_00536 TaxID=2975769 RepID=UPI002E81F7D3|nr:hypothetical protein [Streptomyces sp. NBC_00536]WUC83486.1 hypothetical protein OHS33_37115 [Streptomyces sp. NBC_00536]